MVFTLKVRDTNWSVLVYCKAELKNTDTFIFKSKNYSQNWKFMETELWKQLKLLFSSVLFSIFWFVVVVVIPIDEGERLFLLLALPVALSSASLVFAFAKRKDLNRSVGWTVFFAPFLVFTFVGPFFLISSLMDRHSRVKIYQKSREKFLQEYPDKRRSIDEKRAHIVSQEVREQEFLQCNPEAVLRRAPRDAREFELIAASWMQFWGERDAVATQFSGDGGIDVLSSNYGAQVKFYSNKPVGRPEIQALVGAAAGHGVSSAFFAYSTGYTAEALQWAADMDVACFTFIPRQDNTFEFEANTDAAAELILREEGIGYADYVEWQELETQYLEFQHELPAFLRKNEPEELSVRANIDGNSR